MTVACNSCGSDHTSSRRLGSKLTYPPTSFICAIAAKVELRLG
ncbi:Uncharacterised protein [Vibrio cholerae]|nr:Uncharacterised protein [Vibrio cholerae]